MRLLFVWRVPGREQRQGPMPEVVVERRSARPGCSGGIGAVRSCARILLFASTESTIGLPAGSHTTR
jgi:hypothetical protein